MLSSLNRVRAEFLETRSERVSLVLIAALAAGFAVLALLGHDVGAWGLLFLCGGLLSTIILAAAAHSERWRRPAMIAAALSLPVWLAAWVVLLIFAPRVGELLNPFFMEGGADYPGAFIYGVVLIAMIRGLGLLLKSNRSENS